MAKRRFMMLAPVVLLVIMVLGLVPGSVAVQSDDQGNKISGSLELLMWEKSGLRTG
jgi:hypothetical protein